MEQKLIINGVNLSVKIEGDGFPFIWLHGLMNSVACEDEVQYIQFAKLSKKFKLIRVDVRGHGKSDYSKNIEDYEWPNLAKDIQEVIKRLEIKECILGGLSMGTGISLYTTLLIPNIVKCLVLILPPTAWETRPVQSANYRFLAILSNLHLLNALYPFLLELRPFIPRYIEVEQKGLSKLVNKHLLSLNKNAYNYILKGAANSDYPEKSELQKIKVPMFISTWHGDKNHPESTSLELNKLFPNSELKIAKNYSEYMEWTDSIISFIEKNHIGVA